MQTVVITGAASGIGLACAQRAAQRGWRCVLLDRDGPGLERLIAALPRSPLGEHIAQAIDLTDAAAIAALPQALQVAGLSALAALINNAGMSDDRKLPLVEQGESGMQRLLALNLQAPARLVEALAPLLVRQARVVNVASGAGLRAIPWRGAYSPSKAGLIAQTQALAQARPDWCVTVLSPGFVRTELVETLIAEGRLLPERALAKIPLGRMAAPAEMAEALCFLASPAAAPLSGQVLALDGGSSIYGGSQALAPTDLQPLPLDSATAWTVQGDDHGIWNSCRAEPERHPAYPAWLDVSPLHSAGQLSAVYAAAVRFAQQQPRSASLTLLLPAPAAGRWQDAGDAAAARMLITTLACEWGGSGRRINALECAQPLAPQVLQPLLDYLGGAQAQYLTGQVLRCQAVDSRSWPCPN